jgi:hypothetical protein
MAGAMKANTRHKTGLGAIVPNAGAPAQTPLCSMHQASLPMAIAPAPVRQPQRQN